MTRFWTESDRRGIKYPRNTATIRISWVAYYIELQKQYSQRLFESSQIEEDGVESTEMAS